MRTNSKVVRHPIHPMLVPAAITLWVFSLVCDGFYVFGSGDPAWRTLAYYSMVAGIVAALASALIGLLEIPSLARRATISALAHVAVNVAVAGLYALNVWQRTAVPDNVNGPIFLSALALGVLALSGWLREHVLYMGEVAATVAKNALRRRMLRPKSFGKRSAQPP